MNTSRAFAFVGVLGGLSLSPPAVTQSLGQLKETWDGGKTWAPEGTGRPNQPANVPRPPTVEEIAQQQAAAAEAQRHHEANSANDRGLDAEKRGDLAEAERQFEEALAKWDHPPIRQNLGRSANKLGIEAQQRGDLAAAEQALEKALANWDHPVIRQNLESVRAQIRGQQREQQEWHDAPVVAKMHAQLQQLSAQLGTDAGPVNFDSAPVGPSTALPSGLDFVGLPERLRAPAAGGFAAAPELNDPMVVDLSGAKSLVVDPTKVAGGLPPAGEAQLLTAVPAGRVAQARAALTTTDPAAQAKAAGELRDALNADLRQAAREQDEAHREMLDDLRMLRANGPTYADALAAAQQRIQVKEMAAFADVEKQHLKEFNAEIERLKNGGHYDEKVCDEMLTRLRHAQAGVLRDGYNEMAQEIARLRQELIAATNGQPIIPIRPEDEKLLEELIFSALPPTAARPQ